MRGSTIGRRLGELLVLAVAVSGPGMPLTASAAAVPVPGARAAAAVDPAVIGTAPYVAAGSCWEVKQLRPSAADGRYWLLTPTMPEPQEFYCDMTTDGGGWVLVGKGRNGWTPDYEGKGRPDALLTPAYGGGADTHQLPSRTIDQLLAGGRVADLADGVRLRRARDAAGSGWQEVRLRMSARDRWVWSFHAGHPLSGYAIDGDSRTGGASSSFGTDNAYRRVITTSRSTTGWNFGFGYGRDVRGSTDSGSHLYAPGGGGEALPVTQVYLRPRTTSTSGFTAIPDSGTAPVEQPLVAESTADVLPWGVTGLAGSTGREGNVEVQAFTQAGDRMYVGGNFRYVQQDGAGTGRVEQPFLAAFDVDTGAWVRTFRPELDEQVRALATLPDGRVVAGGDFTRANGSRATGVVALDPVTGATDPGWRLSVENRVTGGVVSIRTLEVLDGRLYLGGAFTHLSGGTEPWGHYMRNLARVSAADGTPATGWNPELNGTVVDVDGSADLARMYAAGYFSRARGGVPATNAAAVLTTAGAQLATPAWSPVWSNTSKHYQQAIADARDRVWVGGSEHNLFSFSATTFERLSTDIFDPKGDVQAVRTDGDLVYAGCHCNHASYSGATTWPGVGSSWTQADTVHWVGAWDARTGQRLPAFTPTLRMRLGSGVWAITTDSAGRLWIGGDLVSAGTRRGPSTWAGGFARFAPRDVTAPSAPGSFRVVGQDATTVRLAWDGSADPSGVRYQVLRDDRPIAVTTATSIELPQQGGRYFVRAADGAGNISASTPVLEVPADVPETSTVVAADASWRWRYATEAPPSDWAQRGFDDSGWQQGGAVLGWGADSVVTDIDSFAPEDRPRAAYFRHAFEVVDPGEVAALELTGVANDGAVFYVNGVEVARQNMPSGAVTHRTYAATGRRESAARADPVVVEVPLALLRPGTNVVAAQTHLNYRRTPDLTFELEAVAILR